MTSSSATPVPPPSPADEKRNLHACYAVGLFSMGQSELLTMVIPLWAVLQGVPPAQIGILIGAKSMLTFFLAIHGGALMDRLGTRRVMMFFALVTAGLAAIYPTMPWFPAMVALQMLIGFAGNMAWIGAQTIIAQVTGGDPGKIGKFSFYARIGNVVAPVLMGVTWDLAGPHIAFLSIAVWSTTMFFVISRIRNPQTGIDTTRRVSFRDILPRLSDYVGSISLILLPAVAFTLAISFTRHATNAVENSFFIVYLRDVGITGTLIGIMFSFAEIMNGFGSLAAGWITRRISMPWVMVSFTAAAIAFLIATPFLGGVYVLLMAAHTLRRIFEGIVQPLMHSLQARAVGRDQQGSVVGLRVTNNRLASIITPIVMGFVVETVGIEQSFVVIGLGLLALCLLLACAVALSPTLRRETRS